MVMERFVDAGFAGSLQHVFSVSDLLLHTTTTDSGVSFLFIFSTERRAAEQVQLVESINTSNMF
jgi:hypothetical protein